MNGWIYLILAGICEMGFTTFMRLSQGFQRWPYTVAFAAFAIASFALVTMATKTISSGICYAIWTGLGSAGTLLLAMLFFHDRLSPLQIFFVGLIVVSVIGLSASR